MLEAGHHAPAAVCGIGWGVCPDHGATLAVTGTATACQECGRSWPGDRLNQPCPEPITMTEEARHLMRTGMCGGHAVALGAVYGIATEPLRPGRATPGAGDWDHQREAADYVRRHYQLPGAKRNARITVDGQATILGFRGGYLMVRYDDQPTSRILCHPAAHVTYPAAGQPGRPPAAAQPGRSRRGDAGTPRDPVTRRLPAALGGGPGHLTEEQGSMTTSAAEPPAVRAGQVWADNDPRAAGRTLRVERLDGDQAICMVLTNSDSTQRHLDAYARPRPHSNRPILRDTRGTLRRIALSRFRPTSTGYRLVEDSAGVPDGDDHSRQARGDASQVTSQ
ncbi:hypothetical protein ACU635_59225 [[Actinomadura] parvosata]|uniref:hypothetical protein n=1 Tax=[Actinomadura] parvosata TaxID=1955412 RepID=UPI00406D067B